MDMDSVTRATEAATALQRLSEIAASLEERPALIRAARAAGIPWAEISEAAHLSRAHINNLAKIGAPETP